MPLVEGLFNPDGSSLGDRLLGELADPRWSFLRAAVAFVKLSGVNLIGERLLTFSAAHPGQVVITVGLDHGGSSIEAVSDLFSILDQHGNELFLAKNPQSRPPSTFHPKLWLFGDASDDRLLLLGSGNLTAGGLFTNYEASVCITGTVGDAFVVDSAAFLERLGDPTEPDVVRADPEVLQRLHDQGDLPSEDEARRIMVAGNALRRATRSFVKSFPVFKGRLTAPAPKGSPLLLPPRPVTIRQASSFAPPPAPIVPSASSSPLAVGSPMAFPVGSPVPLHRFFFITVRMATKTEVFLAKRPLTEDPAFFGAPFRGLTTAKLTSAVRIPQPQAEPQPRVRIELHSVPPIVVDNHDLKLWTYTYGKNANDDFRTNFTAPVQAQIPNDSVVRMERDPMNRPDLQYAIDIFPPSHPQYPSVRALCVHELPGHIRWYGWL